MTNHSTVGMLKMWEQNAGVCIVYKLSSGPSLWCRIFKSHTWNDQFPSTRDLNILRRKKRNFILLTWRPQSIQTDTHAFLPIADSTE